MLRAGSTGSVWVRLLALAAVAVTGTRADAPRLCWEDLAGLAAPARASLVRELQSVLPGLEIHRATVERPCEPERTIRLTILDEQPGHPADALGLAYTGRGRIEPRLEVFLGPVVRLTGAADWEIVGRALARVAAHEAVHYLEQRAGHDEHGLFSEYLTADTLTRRERLPMRLALARPR